MINKIFCLILVATYLNLIESSPHHIRRHPNYYHHRSPYQVNYSPYNLPKRPYFGVESIYNDLDDSLSNEPVKGGIKSHANPNQIKTPMKVLSERKNGYLDALGGINKRINPSSIKQQQPSYDSSIVYPSEETNDSPALPIFSTLNKKKIDSSKKGVEKLSSDTKSTKTNSAKNKITVLPETNEPIVNEKPVEPIKIEKPVEPIKIEKPVEPVVDSSISEKPSEPIKIEKPVEVVNEKPIVESSKVNDSPVKVSETSENVLDAKVSNTNEQPAATTIVPDSLPAKDLEIKVDISSSVIESDASKSSSKPVETVKLESIEVKPEEINVIKNVENVVKTDSKLIEKLESTNAASQEAPVVPSVPEVEPIVKPEINLVKASDSIAAVESSSSQQPVIENKPTVVENKPIEPEASVVDAKKAVVEEKPIIKENTSPVTESKSNSPSTANEIKSSVDVPPNSISPVLSNTDNSIVESETSNPLIN